MESEADRTDVPTFDSWYVCATDYKGWFTLFALRLVFAPTSTYVFRDNPTRYRALPPLGEAVDDLDVFVAGEAEVDEPLAVEQPRRLLQQDNPPPVGLDQIVIGGEDVGDLLLHFDGRTP